MLISPHELAPEATIHCKVCIIGSGAAGITLALELGRRGIDTVCVSGGGFQQRADDRDFYRGDILDAHPHEPLEVNRARVFGGSTTLWGGRLVPFDPIDFERRDFVPLSGWPISYGEMAHYIPRAAELCESRMHNFDLEVASDSNDLPPRLGASIVTNRCERWSMPTNFAQRYAAELRQNRHVRVLLDHHCLDVELDETRSHVHQVKLCVRGQAPQWVSADLFVLACGGLENTRLLLASRRQMPEGIGNQHDLVGRCYMGHIVGIQGFLRLNLRRLPNFYRFTKDEHGMYLRRRLWLTAAAQLEKGLMNIVAFPLRPEPSDPSHGDPLLSLTHVGRTLVNRDWNDALAALAPHVRNILFANPLAWINALPQVWRRVKGSPRLPFLLPYHRKNLDTIFFQSEHAPNPHSRLVLSDQVDEFGMPRLQPRVAFSDIDAETVVQFYAILDRSLRELNLGFLEYTEPGLREYIRQTMQNYASHAHHIGTTRMSASPREGVVDSDSRVHGINNLYIAGSSVFPTSGHANPTLTILALTLRLADCLAAANSKSKVLIA